MGDDLGYGQAVGPSGSTECAYPAHEANSTSQNLVPLLLLLRPMRFVLDAGTLRPVRIALLKATHWPFVAMILGYERWRLHLEHHSSRPVRDLNSANALRRPLSVSGRWMQKTVASGR